jgi:hypothetical protein
MYSQHSVFERSITLPGCPEESLAVAAICQLQLCMVLKSPASKFSDLCAILQSKEFYKAILISLPPW